MTEAAQSEQESIPAPAEVAQEVTPSGDEHLEQVPESFNIFTEEKTEDAPAESETKSESRKSKQFLDKIKRDKEVRQQEIQLKKRQASIAEKEKEVENLLKAKELLSSNPDEFLKSQGLDPMEFYRTWTEKIINSDGKPSIERQLSSTQEEIEALKNQIQNKEQAERMAMQTQKQTAIFNNLCAEVEQYATSSEGFETIKENCTAKDIVNGMVTHYRQTGEEITIEEAFEKIESGLRQREEKYFSDPKIMEKLRRHNPEAFKTVSGPQATLSAKWKEQPTRKTSDEMTDEELMEFWSTKGKLFT
tara:strand:- start:15517 stop:16428 length:912 start_codon:yes stop_codon:yes gene_type:complete